jgi:hypothetical protein
MANSLKVSEKTEASGLALYLGAYTRLDSNSPKYKPPGT